MKSKKTLKIEALEIAWRVLDGVDICMWDNEEEYILPEQEDIIKYIKKLSMGLYKKVNRLKSKK